MISYNKLVHLRKQRQGTKKYIIHEKRRIDGKFTESIKYSNISVDKECSDCNGYEEQKISKCNMHLHGDQSCVICNEIIDQEVLKHWGSIWGRKMFGRKGLY